MNKHFLNSIQNLVKHQNWLQFRASLRNGWATKQKELGQWSRLVDEKDKGTAVHVACIKHLSLCKLVFSLADSLHCSIKTAASDWAAVTSPEKAEHSHWVIVMMSCVGEPGGSEYTAPPPSLHCQEHSSSVVSFLSLDHLSFCSVKRTQ